LKDKRQRSDKLMIIFGLLVALAFSFSRSAWIGLLLSLLIIAWLSLRNQKTRNLLLYGLGGLAILVGVLAFALRNNSGFESVLYHTDHTSQIAESSNEGHSAAFKSAGKDIIHEPLGRGVGTAGPESTYNYGHYGRIAENYFMQIGQETGIVGIALLIAILVAIGKALWNRRQDPLALWLLASLVGITFINLLSHAWTDDTLAYLWWGYAAIALAQRAKNT
jgi:O-antigen ligase